MLVAVPLGCGV
jgi:hypothetical protein